MSRASAGAAVWLALVTGAITAILGATAWQTGAALAYVVVAASAQFLPGALLVQVVGGQALVGSLLVAPEGPPALLLLPLVACVVATAELSAAAQRSRVPWARDGRDDVRRAWINALVGAGAFGVVALVERLPGPGGLLAITLGVGACVALAGALVRHARG